MVYHALRVTVHLLHPASVLGSRIVEFFVSTSIADLTMSMAGDLSWSRQNLWPNGVRTNEDMNRFARLLAQLQAWRTTASQDCQRTGRISSCL